MSFSVTEPSNRTKWFAGGIRLWWFRRKMASDPAFQAPLNGRTSGAQATIEGEYRVVVEEREHGQG